MSFQDISPWTPFYPVCPVLLLGPATKYVGPTTHSWLSMYWSLNFPPNLLTLSSFRLGENMSCLVFIVFLPSLIVFLCEETLDGKLILSASFSYLSVSLLFPNVGLALLPLPVVSVLRFRLPHTETSGEKNQKSFHLIKSLLILILQISVCVSVFLLRTWHFLLS